MSDPLLQAVEAYFADLRDIRAMGGAVAEISYYPAVRELLDEVGRHLKPKVRAIMQLRNAGAGNPDGGLFTQNQWRLVEDSFDPLSGQIPARGAIEVKGTAEDAFAVAASEQVARYAERYGLVLVTNLRDFVLVRWENGGARVLESIRLAPDERTFLGNVNHSRTFAEAAGEGLTEFLKRVMLQNAPLSDPKDLAWFLASYARTARLRLEHKRELPALDQLRSQLEDALGLKFEGDKGDHFFRSTLVQTLFYGMFASWVLWAREREHTQAIDWRDRFQWETATATLHVPMVYELFRQFADVRQLGALGISEVLEWAEEVIWRIDRPAFFEKFREEHAVQYFYEPFLEAFDPELRKELGVWYTPDEVVRYMVARVDTVLREELGIADGLADESVVILDPCCGTGAYLVEVLRRIDETLTAKGADALTRQDVKRAAMSRVIGFEIMPAPFVIAHLNLGILLAELEVPLRDADERAAVYLTNALTGWGDGTTVAPPKDRRVGEGQMHSTLLFPEFAEERDAADRIKREEQILVVIGNPPYNRYVAVAADEERDLSEAYKTTKVVPKPQGMGLNDLYVRFFRLAERQIAERSGRGLTCFISNYSWLDGLSYTGMREHLQDAFTDIFVDNLHGDRIISEYAPDGGTSETVFALGSKSPGIKVGTCVSLMVRSAESNDETMKAGIHYRDFEQARASDRTAAMLRAANDGKPAYRELDPVAELGLPFRPRSVDDAYLGWPKLIELFPKTLAGVSTARDEFLVDIDRAALERRIEMYFDPGVPDAQIALAWPKVMQTTARFDALATRRTLLGMGVNRGSFQRVRYRPFDDRWVYWYPETKLLDEKRPDLQAAVVGGASFLVAQQKPRRDWSRPQWAHGLIGLDLMDRGAQALPTSVSDGGADRLDVGLAENLSRRAHEYATNLDASSADLMFHALAILHSPAYGSQNSGGLRQDWPRVPLPRTDDGFQRSVTLGARIAELLEPGGRFDDGIRLGVLSSVEAVQLDPSTDLSITARWGVAGNGGICMPSTGKLTERPYTTDERAAIAEAAAPLGMSGDEAIGLLGETCFDVYLNDVAYWRCVPVNVWRYTIGGYQVIKKWLSYRERALLGRDLKPEEARYVTEMVRRIAALVLMGPELDANYERVKADMWEWGK